MAGVERLLGLGDGLASPSLVAASRLWPGWAAREPALRVVAGPADVDGWVSARRAAGDWAEVDELVAALGRLGAAGQEPAPLVLAWMLRRPAQKLVGSLRHLGSIEEIEHLVAVNLWLTCRAMPSVWRSRVAANVIGSVRARALIDVGYGSRQDATAGRTQLADPLFWDQMAAPIEVSAADAVLAWAVDEAVLSPGEMALLLALLDALDVVGDPRTGQWAGVTSRAAAAAVAEVMGLSEVTVRRQAIRALRALRDACGPTGQVA